MFSAGNTVKVTDHSYFVQGMKKVSGLPDNVTGLIPGAKEVYIGDANYKIKNLSDFNLDGKPKETQDFGGVL